MKLQIATKSSVLCLYLQNTNDELGGLARVILLFAKLLWFSHYKNSCSQHPEMQAVSKILGT